MLGYSYFKGNYKSIAKNLSEQEARGVDSKAIQYISSTVNLDCDGNTTMHFFLEELNNFRFFGISSWLCFSLICSIYERLI